MFLKNISKFISNKLSDYVKNNIISNEEAINLNNNYNCMYIFLTI